MLGRDADAGIGDRYRKPALAVHPARQLDRAARRRELGRVGEQIEQHLLGLQLVGPQQRQIGWHVELLHETGAANAVAHQLAGRVDRVAQVEHDLVEVKLARLGLRQVENVVDDLEQMRAAVVDIGDIGAIFFIRERAEYFAQDHLGKPDDRVQWGTQLVAHGGEERRFRLVRRLGLFAGRLPLDDASGMAERNTQPDPADQKEDDQRDRGGFEAKVVQEFPDRRVDREGAHHIVQLPIVVRLQPVVTIDAAALAGNRRVYRSEDLFLADRQELRDRGRIGPADERLDRRGTFRVRWRRRDRASGPAGPAQPDGV